MGRRGAVVALVVLGLLATTGCLERPSQADKDAVRQLITTYLQERATRLTQAGDRMNGSRLTSVRLSKKFASRTSGDAAKLDVRRRNSKHQFARAEVAITLTDLDLDGDEATATVRDDTTLFRTAGEPARFSTEREFTLDREKHGWALSGQTIAGPDLEQNLPDPNAPR